MGMYRIPLSQDTWITEESISGNGGADTVLNIGSRFITSSGHKFNSRILGMIDTSSTSDLVTQINNGYIPNLVSNTSITATLRMFNTTHGSWRATNFNIEMYPLITSWVEGRGVGFNLDNNLLMSGFANYVYNKTGSAWTTSGGDFVIDSSSGSQYFVESEDLNLNITKMVSNWLAGLSTNNGFVLKLSASAESKTGSLSASTDQWRKSFFSRETPLLNWPRIEFVWNDFIYDYRNILQFGNSGNIYFYNIINNAYQDLADTNAFPGYVSIQGLTSLTSTSFVSVSSSLSALTAARVAQGIYVVNVSSIPYAIYPSYVQYIDKWIITSSLSSVLSSTTGSLTILSPINSGFSNVDWKNISLKVLNIHEQYEKGNRINFRLFVKDSGQQLQSLTSTSTAYTNIISTTGYWRVLTINNNVDIDWQPLSFDSNGNFFVLDTNNLTRNTNYKIDFSLNIKNQNLYFDGNQIPAQFRVI